MEFCQLSHRSIPACRADLLPLEPGMETCGMEDVAAGQLFAPLDHLLTTDNAQSVHLLELFHRGIRIAVCVCVCVCVYEYSNTCTRTRVGVSHRVLRFLMAW